MSRRDAAQDTSGEDKDKDGADGHEEALSTLGTRAVPDTLVRIPIQPGT